MADSGFRSPISLLAGTPAITKVIVLVCQKKCDVFLFSEQNVDGSTGKFRQKQPQISVFAPGAGKQTHNLPEHQRVLCGIPTLKVSHIFACFAAEVGV